MSSHAMHQLSTGFSLEELQILKKKHSLQVLRHTKLTSNYHPENLVTNAIVRAQAQKSFSSSGKLLRKESYIHNYYKPLQKTQKNTLISFQWIRTFPHQYQHFLERLSDFLLDGENWWSETNEGVDFADVTPVQPSKTNTLVQQFHFRSNTVKTVQTYI